MSASLGTYTSAFYAIEAVIQRSFVDPVGPADQGWLAAPCLALCQIEAAPTTSGLLRASDAGYRTLSSDAGGVQAYPPKIVEAFSIDVSANLDPTKSGVGVAWGEVVLTNMDHAYDSLVTAWQNDGKRVTVYRGVKVWDNARNLWIDPAYASLVPVFIGVMAAWKVLSNTIVIALRDASYYIEAQVPRNLYTGLGGYTGTSALVGATKPLVLGGNGINLRNVTPTQMDPAKLIYQVSDGSAAIGAVYDGGVPLTFQAAVTDLYTGTTSASNYRTDTTRGLFQLGSQAIFNVTADVNSTAAISTVAALALWALSSTTLLNVPAALLGSASGALQTYGVDATVTAAAVGLLVAVFLESNDNIDGVACLERLITASGAYLVPGRDGKLRLLVLAAIPTAATAALTFDDTTVVSIESTPLPATVDPPAFRMRLGYGRNWTVQTSGLAGAIDATRKSFVASQTRVVTAVATPSLLIAASKLNDIAVIGTDGGSLDYSATGTASQPVNNAMIALWGVRRRLYQITVPQDVGLTLDWASVVRVVSDFDGLQAPGRLGQVVGWSYRSADATVTFKVLV